MKQIGFLSPVILLTCMACNNRQAGPGTAATGDSVTVSARQEELKKKAGENKAGLEKLAPLSFDQLKSMIPSTLMGAPRTEYNVTDAMGAGMAYAEYSLNDSTTLVLSFYDCGGPAGSGIYAAQFLSMKEAEHENDDEYIRHFSNSKLEGYEQCDKTTGECTISFFSKDRFLVSLQAPYTGPEALKKAAEELKF